jgi:hypothetical protein
MTLDGVPTQAENGAQTVLDMKKKRNELVKTLEEGKVNWRRGTLAVFRVNQEKKIFVRDKFSVCHAHKKVLSVEGTINASLKDDEYLLFSIQGKGSKRKLHTMQPKAKTP